MVSTRQVGRLWLVSGAISGCLSVALGAFGAHSIKYLLNEYGTSIYEKAVIYQMFHSLALFAVGVIQVHTKDKSYSMAGWAFSVGIVLFSGSLYLLALTGMKWLGGITPIGGTALLFGWAWLAFAILKRDSLS